MELARVFGRAHGLGLLEEDDGGHAAVSMMKDELDEALAGGEPARACAAPELEARLAQRGPHDQSVERPSGNLHLLDAHHLRRAVDPKRREVTAGILRAPDLPGRGVRRQQRIEAEVHQVERREEVAALAGRQRLRAKSSGT